MNDRMAMIAITTGNSIIVKPCALRLNPQHPKAAAQLNRVREDLKTRN